MATKFMLSAEGETLQDFLPGRFRLRVFSLGAWLGLGSGLGLGLG